MGSEFKVSSHPWPPGACSPEEGAWEWTLSRARHSDGENVCEEELVLKAPRPQAACEVWVKCLPVFFLYKTSGFMLLYQKGSHNSQGLQHIFSLG